MDRGIKRTREESNISINDTTNMHVEVTTGEGVTVKLQLPPTATVLMVKQEVESELGIRPREAIVFSGNKARTEKLQDEETLASLLVGEEAKLELSLLVEQADMQQVVPELSAEPSMVLGNSTRRDGDMRLSYLTGAVFLAVHPDWLVTIEQFGHRIKISNIRTGALVCKFGEDGEEVFQFPAVASDRAPLWLLPTASTIVQILRLVLAHLRVRPLPRERGGGWRRELNCPCGIALLQSNEGQVCPRGNRATYAFHCHQRCNPC
jgi:hypothetical protein